MHIASRSDGPRVRGVGPAREISRHIQPITTRCARSTEARRNQTSPSAFQAMGLLMEETMGRGLLLWLLGVPIPMIIFLWLFFGH